MKIRKKPKIDIKIPPGPENKTYDMQTLSQKPERVALVVPSWESVLADLTTLYAQEVHQLIRQSKKQEKLDEESYRRFIKYLSLNKDVTKAKQQLDQTMRESFAAMQDTDIIREILQDEATRKLIAETLERIEQNAKEGDRHKADHNKSGLRARSPVRDKDLEPERHEGIADKSSPARRGLLSKPDKDDR